MDRKLLKSQAKDLIRTSDPKPVYMAIIYLVIIAVLGFLSYKIVGGSTEAISSQFTNGFRFSINEYGEYAPSVDPEQYYYALQEAMPTPAESLLDIAISLVTTVLGAGFYYTLNRFYPMCARRLYTWGDAWFPCISCRYTRL